MGGNIKKMEKSGNSQEKLKSRQFTLFAFGVLEMKSCACCKQKSFQWNKKPTRWHLVLYLFLLISYSL